MQSIAVGIFRCNCAVVACEATREAIVIDPGDEPERILEIIHANGLHVVSVIHTHAHIDHVMAAHSVVEDTGAEARLHAGDRRLWQRMASVASTYCIPAPLMPPLADALEEGETIRFGRERIRVIHTPGHTAGSCCFALDLGAGEELLFSGDTLLPSRSARPERAGRRNEWRSETMLASIRDRLLTFPDDTRVIPGHGAEARIGIERRHNPRLSGAR